MTPALYLALNALAPVPLHLRSQVMTEALKVLRRTSELFPDCQMTYEEAKIGGAGFDAHGVHFPDETRDVCARSDAILFGSIGGPIDEMHLPKWKDAEKNALLGLRKAFGLAVNVRPAKVWPMPSSGSVVLCQRWPGINSLNRPPGRRRQIRRASWYSQSDAQSCAA